MTVICQICYRSFNKLISNTHLASHSMSTHDYKKKFGNDSIASPEYRTQRSTERSGANNPMHGRNHSNSSRNKMSNARIGKSPHNKGKKVTDPDEIERRRIAVAKREERYQTEGNHPRKGKVLTELSRSKISSGVRKYAQENKDELKIRAKKALESKKLAKYDFGSPMRGKKLSTEAREKISSTSKKLGASKHQQVVETYRARTDVIGLEIKNIDGKVASFECKTCSSNFTFTTQYLTKSKFRLDMCPICREVPTKSKDELEILEFIRSISDTTVLSGNRNVIFPLELDIYLPDHNLAVEYCGLYWHGESNGKHPTYHATKQQRCLEKGIRLITIFEDEWKRGPDLIKSRLANMLGKTINSIGARTLRVERISNDRANAFCDEHHIQGRGQTAIAYGLINDSNDLISSMTFSKPSISKGHKSPPNNTWEMNRFCSKQGIRVNGAASRLFKKFLTENDPSEVMSYSDNRWNTGEVYQKLGFYFDHETPPNYWYIDVINVKRIHRFAMRKNKNDNPNLTEWQNRQNQGFDRIWDCGHKKWVWKK